MIALRQITDDERARLWHLLEPMVRAIDAQDVTAVTAAVGRVPDSPIRRCLLAVAKPFIAAYRAAVREYGNTGVQIREPRHVYGRARPDFLGMFTGLSGTVAPVEVWACRTGLYWEKVECDGFAGVNTSRRWHEPVAARLPPPSRNRARLFAAMGARRRRRAIGYVRHGFASARATRGAGGATRRPRFVHVREVQHPMVGAPVAR